MTENNAVILIVEDDPNARRNLAKILAGKGYQVRQSASGAEALKTCSQEFVNIALIDMRLPDIDGLEVMDRLRGISPDTVAIMMTGYASLETAIEAMNLGSYSYITKPMSMDEVLIILSRALEKQRLKLDNQTLMQELVQKNQRLKESQTLIEEQARREREREASARRQAEMAVVQYQSLLQAVFDASLDAIAVIDGEGRFLAANKALLDHWNKNYYELAGHSASELLQPGIFRDRMERIQTVIDQGCTIRFQDEYDGMVFENAVTPIYEPDNSIASVAMFSRDITRSEQAARRIRQLNAELENRVNDRTAQLASANKELESFSQSISHDLQAPLRRILAWNQIVLEDCGSALGEQGRAILEKSNSEARHMSRLIQDLLQFSHVSRYHLKCQPVDLGQMAQSVFDSIQTDEPGRLLDFKLQGNLQAVGDPHLLEIVLTNLVSNACKFTSKKPRAEIEFGRLEPSEENTFYIRDNGAGFDMAFAASLFAPFQRMHSQAEFPGTGIGLALVQRIVHRHGGRVWAESRPDEGTTIFFSVPGLPEPGT